MRFKLQNSTNSQYYFEIQAGGNWATLATSETYTTKAAALDAIALIRNGAAGGSIDDQTT